MRKNKGFILIEILAGMFISSIILIYLIPMLVNENKIMKQNEKKIEMKEILYEELMLYENENIEEKRANYEVMITEDKASIRDTKTGETLTYE